MAKIVKGILKIGAIVAGVVLTPILGPIAAGLISVGLGLGASLISSGKAPSNSAENTERLRASIDPRTPRKTVVGHTAFATDIRDEEFTDNQEYFHRFIVCASHKVDSFEEIWFDDQRVWTAAGGVQGDAVGYLTVATRTEGSAANAINISSRMGSTRRYTGLAYVHLKYKLTGNSKKAESPYAQSITTRITIRGKAAALPDPRDPAQDMADQSTWVWDDDACRNPALALLFYLRGYKINGLLAVGKGIPTERIDLESFEVAANICDELVAKAGGGTEPRYRCDGVWSEGDDPTTVIDMLKATMNADLDDVGGKLRLTIYHNDLADVVADFSDEDIIDDFEWRPVKKLDETFNVVRGTFSDPSNDSLYQQIDYPRQEIASPDGIERALNLNLPMVQSASQAQRLANLRLKRQEFAGTFTANFQATGWKLQRNSILRLSFKQTGFVDKLFRVDDIEIRQDGIVPLVLVEEDAGIYGAPTLQAPITPVPSTPYNHVLNPIIAAINGGAVTLLSKTVAYPFTSDDTSITAVAFSGVTRDGRTISFPAGSISSLTPGTAYAIFYDGTGYLAVGSPGTAEFADPDLIFVQWQATSSGGTYPSGGTAPGGWGGAGAVYQ